jgi:hypothetical protein
MHSPSFAASVGMGHEHVYMYFEIPREDCAAHEDIAI